jgi:hypothetical protein
MDYDKAVSVMANWAAISTAAIAVYGYGRYRCDQWRRRKKLERYLYAEKAGSDDEGKRTVIHLMGRLSMTETEIFAAAFGSKNVSSALALDWDNRATALLFEYVGDQGNEHGRRQKRKAAKF